MDTRNLHWDSDMYLWVLELNEPGKPVLRTTSKEQMEEYLDFLDAKQQEERENDDSPVAK